MKINILSLVAFAMVSAGFGGITLATEPAADQPSAATPRPDAAELLGRLVLPGDRRDLSGLDKVLEDGSPANRFGGLSAIEYTGAGDQFIVVADRGAGDGAVRFPCRFHQVTLRRSAESPGRIDFTLDNTVMMTGNDGRTLNGSLVDHAKDLAASRESSEWLSNNWRSLDPEGIRRFGDGRYLISDEYGPRLIVVDQTGCVQRQFDPTALFRQRGADAASGVYPNRGFEGIATFDSPEANQLIGGPGFVVALQSAMIQDAEIVDGKCIGKYARLAVFDAAGRLARQAAYPLELPKSGISEILYAGEDRFWVLERDGKAGTEAKLKRLYEIRLSESDDVTAIPSLPQGEMPDAVTPATKTLVLDLMDPRFGIPAAEMPEKPEGICWGPELADGRRTLWMACDNDFDPARTTQLFCFAIGPSRAVTSADSAAGKAVSALTAPQGVTAR